MTSPTLVHHNGSTGFVHTPSGNLSAPGNTDLTSPLHLVQSTPPGSLYSLSSAGGVGSIQDDQYLGFQHENNKKRRRQATQAQRRAANIRERKRMLSLNDAFEELRQIVPTFSHEKKISRIDTLRLAIIYISFMTEILAGKEESDIEVKSLKHGWTSVREKLQQQMAAQQQQAAAEMAAAVAHQQAAALNAAHQQLAMQNVTSPNDYCPGIVGNVNHYQYGATPQSTIYNCTTTGTEFFTVDSTHIAAPMMPYWIIQLLKLADFAKVK